MEGVCEQTHTQTDSVFFTHSDAFYIRGSRKATMIDGA